MPERRRQWKQQQRGDAAAQQNFEIPENLLKAINSARPLCGFWKWKMQCKRGAQCTFRHDGSDGPQQTRLPHVSCIRTADGKERLCLRPQLNQAWQAFFRERGVLGKLQSGKMLSENCIMYPMMNMEGKDVEACKSAILK